MDQKIEGGPNGAHAEAQRESNNDMDQATTMHVEATDPPTAEAAFPCQPVARSITKAAESKSKRGTFHRLDQAFRAVASSPPRARRQLIEEPSSGQLEPEKTTVAASTRKTLKSCQAGGPQSEKEASLGGRDPFRWSLKNEGPEPSADSSRRLFIHGPPPGAPNQSNSTDLTARVFRAPPFPVLLDESDGDENVCGKYECLNESMKSGERCLHIVPDEGVSIEIGGKSISQESGSAGSNYSVKSWSAPTEKQFKSKSSRRRQVTAAVGRPPSSLSPCAQTMSAPQSPVHGWEKGEEGDHPEKGAVGVTTTKGTQAEASSKKNAITRLRKALALRKRSLDSRDDARKSTMQSCTREEEDQTSSSCEQPHTGEGRQLRKRFPSFLHSPPFGKKDPVEHYHTPVASSPTSTGPSKSSSSVLATASSAGSHDSARDSSKDGSETVAGDSTTGFDDIRTIPQRGSPRQSVSSWVSSAIRALMIRSKRC